MGKSNYKTRCQRQPTDPPKHQKKRIKPKNRSYEPPINKIRNYKIVLQPRPCNENVELVLGIKSIVTNYDRRKQIRAGWGAQKYFSKYKIKRLFLFGNSYNGKVSKNKLKQLENESNEFDDILIGDFSESFYNLTFKDSMLFTWVKNACKTSFLFKVMELTFTTFDI